MSTVLNPAQATLLRDEKTFLANLLSVLNGLKSPSGELSDLRQALLQLDELFLIVVVGEFNAGKSALINSLLAERLLEEGVTPTTTRITLVKHGDKIEKSLGVDGIETQTFPLDLLRELNFVDTPGTNAVIRHHEDLTRAFIPRSDLVLFVTSADRPFTESERQFLGHIREWGKKIVFVINKRDLFDDEALGVAKREESLRQVTAFVTEHVQQLLGFTPEIFAVSARRAAAGDEKASGMDVLRTYVWSWLDESARLRLKFANPLGVAEQLLKRAETRTAQECDNLQTDLDTVEQVERDITTFENEVKSELKPRLDEVENLILRLRERGIDFFDEKIRLMNVFELARGDRFRHTFEQQVLEGVPPEIERSIKTAVNWLVAKDLAHWRQIFTFLQRRRLELQDQLVGDVTTQSDLQRNTLLDNALEGARAVLASYDTEKEARELGSAVEEAVVSTLVLEGAAVGLGAIGIALIVTRAADPLGIVMAGALGIVGLFIIPYRRAQVKAQFRQSVDALRQNLIRVLTTQFNSEADRALNRLREGIAPYTRFVRGEKERLDQARQSLESANGQLKILQSRVGSLFGK